MKKPWPSRIYKGEELKQEHVLSTLFPKDKVLMLSFCFQNPCQEDEDAILQEQLRANFKAEPLPEHGEPQFGVRDAVETPEDGNEGAESQWPDWTNNSDWQVKQEFPYDGDDASWGTGYKHSQQFEGWNDQPKESWDDQQGQGQSWDDNKGQDDEFPWWAHRQNRKTMHSEHGLLSNAGKQDQWGGHYNEQGYYVDPTGKQWQCLG